MSILPGNGAGSSPPRPAPHNWFFTKEEMRMSASQRDGLSPEEELGHRQQAASFVQEMVELLNQMARDQRPRISQQGMCVANMHMHRFFYFHSFKTFDYRDIAAACLFLSGKSEESPRKLSDVVCVWWQKKFPTHPRTPSKEHMHEAMQLIVTLESLVLQTIAFDLNVDLPHQHVLRIMQDLDRANHHKKITSVAYYFATDILCVMDWGIRYSDRAIAVACVHIVAIYANFKLKDLIPPGESKDWFLKFDSDMTAETLDEMTRDFKTVYTSCSHLHLASLKRLDPPRHPHPSHGQEEGNGPSVLPPPPAAPVFGQKKPDPRAQGDGSGSKAYHDAQMNGRVNRPMDEEEKRRERRRIEEAKEREKVPRNERERYRDRNTRDTRDTREIERLEKERSREEERRKRDHDRMAGRGEFGSSDKRPRIEALSTSFVPSSQNSAQFGKDNGSQSRQAHGNGFVSSSSQQRSVGSSFGQLAAMSKRPDRPLSPPNQPSMGRQAI